MFCLEGVFSVHTILLGQGADGVGRKQDGAQHFVLVGPFIVEEAILRQHEPAFLPQHEAIAALFEEPSVQRHGSLIAPLDARGFHRSRRARRFTAALFNS